MNDRGYNINNNVTDTHISVRVVEIEDLRMVRILIDFLIAYEYLVSQ